MVDGVLEKVSLGAGAQRFAHVDRILVHAEDDDLRLGMIFDDAAGGFHAVDLRHGDIHDDHVGPQLLSEAHGFRAFAGFADHLHIGFLVDDELEALPDHGVVIG